MAKDPAFLFYPNDYIGGTMGMSFEEKGAYIELLMAQFNRGHMTYHMCGQIVGQNLWEAVKHKFVQDAEGLYYNVRLDEEKIKRQNFTQSRRNNMSGKNQYSKKGHMTPHMENENVNPVTTPTTTQGGTGELTRNQQFGKEYSDSTQMEFAMRVARDNKLPCDREFVLRCLRNYVAELEAKMDTKQTYQLFAEHFISWMKIHGHKFTAKELPKL